MIESTVIIVGAGPSGLTLAWWLVNQGVTVSVLEREATIPKDMRASTFHPATLDLLDDSGLTSELVQRGTVVPQWQYLIHETGERAVFDMACLGDVTAYPFRLQCEQFQLTELLTARLAEHPLCTLYFSTTFQDAITEDERVHLRYHDADGAKQGACDWLVAADGASSQVRKSLGLSFHGTVFPRTSITLVMEHPFEEDIPNLLGVNYVWLPDRHYSLMRLRDTWRFTYSPEPGQDMETALSDPVARAHIAQVSPRAAKAIIRSLLSDAIASKNSSSTSILSMELIRSRFKSGTSLKILVMRFPNFGCIGRSAPQLVKSTPVNTISLYPF